MSLHQQTTEAAASAAYQARLFGRYLLVEPLSRGGMGELFVARHGLSGFEKRVVIKKILPHLAADKEFLTRFVDEAQVAVQLQHANIAQVFEVGRVDDEYFLALEHIEGRDLRATIAALAHAGRRMAPEIALYIAREVASGLAYAHRRTDSSGALLDLVHCDISPPDVMMSFDGETKIIDFGIARSALRLSQTDPNRGFGKFGYMSPQQLIRGARVDHRADIYAVGVLLFEMLTGRRLFETGDSPDYHALARQVIRGAHPLPGDVDPALARFDAVVRQALAPVVEDRFQSAAELRDAIQTQLAALAPTFNADHLARFMCELFGERREHSGLDARVVAHWERELTQQAAATVSFARAATAARLGGARPLRSSLVVKAGQAGGVRSLPMPPTTVADGTPSNESHSITLELDLVAEAEAALEPRTRRWSPAVLVVGLVGILAALVLAAVLVRRAGTPGDAIPGTRAGAADPRATDPRATDPRATDPRAADPRAVDPRAADPRAVDPRRGRAADADGSPLVTPLADPVSAARPSAAVRASVDDHSVRRRSAARLAQVAPRADGEPADGKAADEKVAEGKVAEGKVVESHFRAAHVEYQAFTRRFGARLEREWTDLAHFATFGRSPDKVGEFDRRIQGFRQAMQAAAAGTSAD